MMSYGSIVRAGDPIVVGGDIGNNTRIIDFAACCSAGVRPLSAIGMACRNARLVRIVFVRTAAAWLTELRVSAHELVDRKSLQL